MSEEYDLKKSEKGIGQLYPILKSKDGKTIDGFHREAANPNWKSVMLPEIDTEEKLLIARAVANWHRREVPKKEKAEWINGLAEIYQKQGCANMAEKIANVTGLGLRTVYRYLNPEYKQQQVAERIGVPRTVASEVIRRGFDAQGEGYGERLVERHREEVLEEAKLSPKEKAEAEERQKQTRFVNGKKLRGLRKFRTPPGRISLGN